MLFLGVYYKTESEKKFKSACDQVRKFSKRPPDNDLLELYSLYKQATVGNVNTAKPSGLEDVKKWEAWNAKKGIAISSAKEQYIAKAKVLAAKPSGLEDVKKWEAWNAKKGIAISSAKEQYIAKAKVLAGTYA
ncbi:putative acyl-CoA-binding protein isoform X5 [Diabrotica virgifera virgifera]|uniref:ACB domain-containing protein n=1 Tax=Diabrotica virgifera virgifera TaxID=50390 RepID=A0ABM5JYL0_DIAVI|nr:putative acyl-CoA-binding protein isoform X4 [Diabrotica virgifera virgifera]XP_050503028.1 putative acyl-CoA-binding protein isoform X5 [Diabrotica virgifera virgifera]